MPLDSNETKRKWIGFSYAWAGVQAVVRNERNFRLHLVATVIVLLLGFILQISAWKWCILLLTVSNVLTLEMVNSAIERIMDHLSPSKHPLVGEIKDIAAGAVLVAAIVAVIIGCIVFIPELSP
ncbi:DeoR family transcriptional regulator [Pontibacillus halophilus JSM 076056 = DSM 19796]|uniref:DeoR family transcriptional regulator n=1 Tax=Pontibacillus halophilus JSM 076056 = DSM 19796 TaxID=1385510 RepID=A0A0A5GQT0_9BACI|nr:diacylglycerol kinase [Pontibacillus halophilus]KGX93588.1 DeoR family transcriptional regulator [Pontibacillus halophilus JSM 076056 = DSM 19796]